MSSVDHWDKAVEALRAALFAERKYIAIFLLGWLTAWVVCAALWLITPERFC